MAVASQSVYDTSREVPAQALLTSQMNPSAPAITQLQTTTNGLISDRTIRTRLAHFPEDLYDLRDESHLVRFMAALLGDAGAGQLRKRYLLARIQTVLDSATFFDLDGFYGAIFGSGRTAEEILPVDPYTDVETPDSWDQIMATDARYRERITALAAAIPLAATLPGIRQAAEALTGAECEIYEIWRFMDAAGSVVPTMTWIEVESAYPAWSSFDTVPVTRWNDLDPSGTTMGVLGVNSPAEVIVRVKKEYPPGGSVEQTMDEFALTRVLGILRPANTVITVDPVGIPVTTAVPIGSVYSDSNFWEVVTKVTPNVAIKRSEGLYPLSPSQIAAGVEWGEQRTLPRPPLFMVQGLSWEQASAVVSVQAYAATFDDDSDLTQAAVGVEVVLDPLDYQTITFFDGSEVAYSAERGAADPKSVQGGISAAGGILTAAPFAGARTTVVGA